MSPQSIVCTTCEATVPYGRLSCPACGELLASVAGAARSAKPRAASARAARDLPTERAAPAVLVDVPPEGPTDEPSEAAAWANERPDPTHETTSTSALGWEAAAPDMHEPDKGGSSDEVLAAPGREPPIFQRVSDGVADDAAVQADAAAHVAPAPADGATNGAAVRGFSTVAWPTDQVPPVPESAVPRPAPQMRSVPDAPGAYVPPVLPPEPAGPPAPARAWAGQAAADPDTSKAGASATSMAGDLLDAARVTEFVSWLAVAGSAMAAVGFLLPWGVSVIGASGVGYFDRWGLAGPFHPIVFLSLLAVLGLSLVPNRIPLWLRVGVLGLGLGALLLGLTWPYVVGLSGTGPGAMVVAVGALVLGAAGIGALATDRHAHEDRAV